MELFLSIQPIDLQNMYSQISNVARNVGGQQQAAQVQQSVQQQNQIQKNIESSQRVQQASNDKSNTNNVNPDGHSGGSGGYSMNQKKKQQQPKDLSSGFSNYGDNKPDYLGTIVDITR